MLKGEQLNAVREPQKVVFKGDPVDTLADLIGAEQWDLTLAGLEVCFYPLNI